jgi:hypothetical protein
MKLMTESWTAVVCGAVLGGVELSPSTIKTKAVPITYGINLTEHFRSTENNYRDIFADPKTRRVYPGGSMCWMIKQGDLVMATDHLIADKEMLYTFSEEQGDTLTLPVYMYDREDLPKRFAEVASGMYVPPLSVPHFLTFFSQNFKRFQSLLFDATRYRQSTS